MVTLPTSQQNPPTLLSPPVPTETEALAFSVCDVNTIHTANCEELRKVQSIQALAHNRLRLLGIKFNADAMRKEVLCQYLVGVKDFKSIMEDRSPVSPFSDISHTIWAS
jgi:hypothetical protein